MSHDHRAFLRREETLPFAWRPLDSGCTTPADVCDALALPRTVALQAKLGELGAELDQAAAALSEPGLRTAFGLLDAKVGVLEEAVMADAPIPPRRSLELSGAGIGFRVSGTVEPGAWIGVHLVLPVSYHLVSAARVTHCTRESSGQRLGAELVGLAAPAARHLTRFVISRTRSRPRR
ncbi:MAG: hypothetical protein ACODAC_02255 [Pseudomonadota bacterium]